MIRRIQSVLVIAFAALTGITAHPDDKIPAGFVVPKCTISPDGRYGVTVPIRDQHEDTENPKNSVIELKTGKIITVIQTKFTGWNRMNHGGVLPCQWSSDGSLLLWTVDGKWFPDAVVVLKFKNGALEWQTDVTAVADAEILKHTRSKAPEQYTKAKKANRGSGSAYPEGFSIYVTVSESISLPLRIRATLTSDPKQIEGFPRLESYLTGEIDGHGRFLTKDFAVTPGCWEKFVENNPGPEPCDMPEPSAVNGD